jgi:hypothetical protein
MYVVTVKTPRPEPEKHLHTKSYRRNLETGPVKAHSCMYLACKVKVCVSMNIILCSAGRN